jgi:Flp pilus assembly protein TadG
VKPTPASQPTARRGRSRGQALVEFVLVAPILLIVLLGILQFGIVLHDYISVTNAADAAARKASVTATQSNAQDLVISTARAAAPDLNVSNLGVTVSPGSPWSQGQDVTVTVSYPYSVNVLGVVIMSGNLQGKTVTRVW